MTITEMEEVLKKLDRRLANVEQILPTLATKEDLKAYATQEALNATREEMRALFAEGKRHATILFERTEERLEILTAHLADISQRLPRK